MNAKNLIWQLEHFKSWPQLKIGKLILENLKRCKLILKQGLKRNSIILEVILDENIHKLYNDWLDASRHSSFTRSIALIEPRLGSEFYTYNGYVSGKIVALIEYQCIVHLMRTSDFAPDDRDSFLEVSFEKWKGKSKIILMHSNIPPYTSEKYIRKWFELYINPLQQFYSK